MLLSANLESLCERAVVGAVRLEPFLDEDVVAELVLGDGPAGVAPGATEMERNQSVS